jgi:hypothetical protein
MKLKTQVEIYFNPPESKEDMKKIEDKVMKLAKKLYPNDTEDWNARHRALALVGQLIGWMERNKLIKK